MTDINAAMLNVGRDRMTDRGHIGNIAFAQVNAEALPFPDDSFDLVTIAFGLRNVTDKQKALAAMQRVLKPGGRALVLEFSKPLNKPLEKLYDLYSFRILPKMGDIVAKDADSYRYLAESIRMHPGSGNAARHDGAGRVRPLRRSQPHRRHRRRAPRLQVLSVPPGHRVRTNARSTPT